jgi:tRNA(Ile)-lysidine synthase
MAFCQSICSQWEISLQCVKLDIPALAQSDKIGLEEAARKYRYRALEQCAAAGGINTIATAHTATDNLETVLLQLTRGCSSVIGIPPVRDAYIRPLLSATREDILRYLEEWNLPHVEDSTNESDSYSRNLIRHRVLPVLLELNPKAEAAFQRATTCSRQDNAYLDEMAAPFAERGKVSEIAELPLALRTRTLKIRCEQLGLQELSHTHLLALSRLVERGASHSSLSLPGGCVSIEDGYLVLTPPSEESSDWEILLKMGENPLPDGSMLYLSDEPDEKLEKYIFSQQNIYKLLTKCTVNFATIERTVIARPRRAGDRILYGGMHRSVKKLYCDAHLSLETRRTAPLICNETDILWIPIIKMISDRAAEPHQTPLHMIWFRN